MLIRRLGLALVCACVFANGSAEEIEAGTEYQRNLHASGAVEAHGSSPFGESIDLYSGGLSFEHVDLRLTGTGPDIVIARRYTAGTQEKRNPWAGFGDWTLVIPQITTFTQIPAVGPYGGIEPDPGTPGKWQVSVADEAQRLARCTNFDKVMDQVTPTIVHGWWFGHQLVTYAGSQELLVRQADSWKPSAPIQGVTGYTGVTKSGWVTGCLPSTSNGVPGEAFLAISPNGERYSLTHLVFNRDETVFQNDVYDNRAWRLYRSRAHMLVSRVSDRFGNTVEYNYQGHRLTNIRASDGRAVDIHWSADGLRIEEIVAHPGTGFSRTWQYRYDGDDLQIVQLPDNSQWFMDLPFDRYEPYEPYESNCSVNDIKNAFATGTIVSPSGATGTFSLTAKRHGRSYVRGAECIETGHTPRYVDNPRFMTL